MSVGCSVLTFQGACHWGALCTKAVSPKLVLGELGFLWQAVKRTSAKERVLGILGHWGAASRPLCTDEHQGSPSAQLSVANVYCAMWFWKEPSTYPPPQPSQPLTRRPKRKPMGHPAFTCLLLPCLSLACLDPPRYPLPPAQAMCDISQATALPPAPATCRA